MAKSKTAAPPAAAPEAPRTGYTVLARRYRPQQFDDCIGQEHVAQSLKNAIESNRVAHAYLFTGSRGVGKTSMARIFAKALNCVRGPTTEPCGECDICQAIAAGEDVDVIEIDGASNRGIDEVRELRQAVNYRPSRAHYKIYIIDEVHMLTKEAFNALLKTLEEPPAHAKFLFATTEAQKIPITILSRCQRFDFSGIDLPRIVERLKSIVAAEGMQADEEALEIIARRAGGSMRDSQSLLDQLLAFGGERLTADEVHRVLGTAGEDRVLRLAEALIEGNAAACLDLVHSASSSGVQLGEWVEQMLDYFRDLMVLAISPEAELVSMPNRLRPTMRQQAGRLTPEQLLERMDLLAACRARMKASTYGRTLLEMTLVRICRLDQFLNLSAALAAGPPATIGTPAPPPRVGPAAVVPAPSAPAEPLKKNDAAPDTARSAPAVSAPAPSAGPEIDLTAETVERFWKTLLERLGDVVLVGMLRTALRVEFQPPRTLVIYFPDDMPQARTYVENSPRLGKIEKLCSDLAGRPIVLRCEQTAAAPKDAPPPERTSQKQLRDLAAANPLVRQAERVLNAKLIAVDAIPARSAPTANQPQDTEPENA